MADIFVSYTSSDKDWAFWIGKELEALGHTPHVHEWEIKVVVTSMPGWSSATTPPTMCSACCRMII